MKDAHANLKALFDAEEAANKTIREAEEKRERMMQQAYSDAHEKAEQFRREKDAELVAEMARDPNNFAELVAQAARTSQQNDAEFARFSPSVTALLIERVCRVRPALHANLTAP